ncbi:MAG: acetate--CoA ligase family protein [Proteobacteria bacterium]|nr:acetate--CoA ligase family protein [Pseudomonadota bacterium]
MDDIIAAALERGDASLSEFDAKALLSAHGFPVVPGALAHTPDEAAAAARSLGFPVAVKACAPGLAHKTEAGAVALHLADEAGVREAFSRVAAAAGGAVLVERMASGSRELAMGLVRDPHFGPCVMLGLGGVFAEALGDTAFRAAPVDLHEIRDMVAELAGKKIFAGLRGMAPVNEDDLFTCLSALSQIGFSCDRVAEVDVNPVIADKNGRLFAADALVVLK